MSTATVRSSLGVLTPMTSVHKLSTPTALPVRVNVPARRYVLVRHATVNVPEHEAPAKARAAVEEAGKKRKRMATASAEESAAILGRFLGLPPGTVAPGAVLDLDQDQVLGILEAVWRRADPEVERALYGHAATVTSRFYGGRVFYRGLVEFSNVCQNDCGYCGIRNNQKDVWRYTMPEEEVVEVAKWAMANNIRNVMLQSGELRTEQRLEYLERVVRTIRAETIAMDLAARGAAQEGAVSCGSDFKHDAEHTKDLGVAVSLSVGELPYEWYERLYKAGARRYLIRIETSNPELYARLHPPPLDWNHRVECLKNLKKVGYMLGTGVMVGLPGQTLRDLAGDIVFFKQIKADMIGMGPFITQEGTPVADMFDSLYPRADKTRHMKAMFELTTAMNALARITLGNVNISATTAMQAIIPTGREIALERGANVVMPILTPTKYRESYQLYEGKPCITDTAVQCRACLDMRLKFAGKTSEPGVWGDPESYAHPVKAVPVPHLDASPALSAAQSADLHEQEATPWHMVPLERLVEVPEDNEVPPQSHPHGSKPKGSQGGNGVAAHALRSHDDGDGHQHPHHSRDDGQRGGSAANNAVPAQNALPKAHSPAGPTNGTVTTAAARARAAGGGVRPGGAMFPGVQGVRCKTACPARTATGRAHGARVTVCRAASTDAPAVGNTSTAAGAGVTSTTAHGVPRVNVGVFGQMNAGKSTLVNILAQQEACIVDATPGTTADVKTVLLELHGLGPSKILDTAGLDETGELGDKKRRKALNTLKECDVAVIVVDTPRLAVARATNGGDLGAALTWEKGVMEQAAKYGVSPVLVLNIKAPRGVSPAGPAPAPDVPDMQALLTDVRRALDPTGQMPAMAVDLSGPMRPLHITCSDFVKAGVVRSPRFGKPLPGCLPRWSLGKGAVMLLIIPMDAETPGGRLLRPQAMVQEEAIRHWATTIAVRLDLDAARGKLGPRAQEEEYQRFSGVVRLLEANTAGPSLIVTDSQAVDVVHPWTLDRTTGNPRVPFTTFSIAMAYHQNGGDLRPFVEGLHALSHLAPGDRVLIAEACNHTRITDVCNDIGMVQIPNKLRALAGGPLGIEHAFGREFPELETGQLGTYKVAIHCGGCMVDTQKMQQRMRDLGQAHVPVVNYGTFFSWAVAPAALQRALEPYGLEPPPTPPAPSRA